MCDKPADDDMGEDVPTWDTQFLHGDDNDTPDFEEEGLEANLAGLPSDLNRLKLTSAEVEEEDLLASTQGQLKRVRVENVNYAKRAKRVDVKKLKDSIWRELEVVTIKVKEVRIFHLSPAT